MSNIAFKAQQELNSHHKKRGTERKSLSADESGVNQRVEKDFPGSEVRYGMSVTGGGGARRKIPPEEGGEYDARGRMTEARHFEGPDGPEEKLRLEGRLPRTKK
ncbi:hypothetical protein VTN96DRAFT_2641 [Rasamsonia emersonii]|uniref:Uncharacterized protein n=1 Tax=Rasamsonia emersonii (strain ATCC 16479 / CBS 393.64 / IMI 116815) TaxID=1408163 RepID=A0A0F4YT92_RASE3|nr:hypothetical protein T310_5126 [Rasamsonia emersonii CBS 393.64]KKA20843.1 hypothetical protein T310_5126 [Rasamsonia emersonii CBS 393.64]